MLIQKDSLTTLVRPTTFYRFFERLAPLIIVCAIVLEYIRTFNYGFYWDDYHQVRPWTLEQVLGTLVGPFDPLGIQPPFYRPLLSIDFALEWHLWGLNPLGYHLTNILWYAVAALALYALLRKFFPQWWLAMSGAIFFAIIPANVATAIWISQRSDAMVNTFIVLCLLAFDKYLDTRKTGWLAGTYLLLGLALMSKEPAIATPGLLAAYYLLKRWREVEGGPARPGFTGRWLGTLALKQTWRSLRQSGEWKRIALVLAPAVVLIVVYLVLRGQAMSAYPKNAVQNWPKIFASAIFYSAKAVPWRFLPLTSAVLALATLLALVVNPGSRTWRIVVFGLVWLALGCIPHAPSWWIDPRVLFLPMAGYAICATAVMAILVEWAGALSASARPATGRTRPGYAAPAWLAVVVLGVALLGITGVTNLKAQEERSPTSDLVMRGDLELLTMPEFRNKFPQPSIKLIEEKRKQLGLS